MRLWNRRGTPQEQSSRNENLSVASGNREEPFPFVALPVIEDSLPIQTDFPPRTYPILHQTRLNHRRNGLQEGADEDDSLSTAISAQRMLDLPSSGISASDVSADASSSHHVDHTMDFNPQHLRHGISQDNQYIRRELQQILARNYRSSRIITIVSDDDGQRRLFAGYSDVPLPPRWLQSQREGSPEPFLLDNQIDQQREWLEVEFHPRLQSALLERHRQHRDEEFLMEYAQHLANGNSLSPQIQEFLLGQAKALESLTQQPLSNYNEDSGHLPQDHHIEYSSTHRRNSSSSLSMRMWRSSHVSSSGASSEANQTRVSELLLPTRNGDDQSDGGVEMDSRFSDEDYMTDYQWTALRLAIIKSNSSLVGKYKKALKASSDLPSQLVPPKRNKVARPTRGVARMSNYDSGDEALKPLVREILPPRRQEVQGKPPVVNRDEPPRQQIQLAMNEAIHSIQRRTCQICQQNVLEKAEYGTNKVTCSMCGAASCYFCRKTIPASGLDHFQTDPTCLVAAKCPLWTDKQTDLEQDKKLARDLLMEIADQVLHETFDEKS